LLVRFPAFFTDVINWDESTFILVGQGLADGHLPYTLLWDNKPPLGYAFFALVELIFPHSLAAIRIAGALVVGVSAFFVCSIATSVMPLGPALMSAALFVITVSSLIERGQAVMMEHIALVPLLAALSTLLGGNLSRSKYFVVGVLFAVAVLVRTNVAFVPLVILAVFPFLDTDLTLRERVRPVLLMGGGGVSALLSVSALYGLTGNGELFFRSTILVPLAYVSEGYRQTGYGNAFVYFAEAAIPRLQLPILSSAKELIGFVFWIGGSLGFLAMTIAAFVGPYTGRRRKLKLIALFSATLLISMLASPYEFPHYLIQVAPTFAISYGLAVSLLMDAVQHLVMLSTLLLIIGSISLHSYGSYAGELLRLRMPYHCGRAWLSRFGVNPAGDPSIFEVAKVINKKSAPGDTIFVSDDTLLYWLTGEYPVVPIAAFSANIFDKRGILKPLYGDKTTPDSVLEAIFSKSPTRIVLIDGAADARYVNNTIFRSHLDSEYHLEERVGDRLIFRRN